MEWADLPAWIGAVGGIAGLAALALEVTHSRGRRKKPDPILRDLLEELFEDFDAVTAHGGQPSAWFLDEVRRRRETKLASLNGAIVDEPLNSAVGAARLAYLDCWAASSVESARQRELQAEAASRGSRSASEAIERLNYLSRRVGHL